MDLKDIAVPGITLVFAAGISFASFESSAQEVDELGTRLSALESRKDVNLGKQEVVAVKIEGIEKRLEEIVQRMLEMQQKQAVSVAKICQATNADCSN